MRLCTRILALVIVLVAGQGAAAQDSAPLAPALLARIEVAPPRDQLGIRPLMDLSPDGSLLALANPQERALDLWDATSGELISRLPIRIGGLAFSPDGTRLAVLTPLIVVLDVGVLRDAGGVAEADMQPLVEQGLVYSAVPLPDEDLRADVASLAFTPDGGGLLLYAFRPVKLTVWDVSEPLSAEVLSGAAPPAERASVVIAPPDGQSIDPYSLITRTDGIYALGRTGGDGPTEYDVVQMNPDPATGSLGMGTTGPVARADGGIAYLSGRLDVFLSATGGVSRYTAGGDPDAPVALGDASRAVVGLSPDGSFVAVTDPERPNAVTYLDAETGELLGTHPVEGRVSPQSLWFSDDGARMAISTGRGTEVWSLRGNE